MKFSNSIPPRSVAYGIVAICFNLAVILVNALTTGVPRGFILSLNIALAIVFLAMEAYRSRVPSENHMLAHHVAFQFSTGEASGFGDAEVFQDHEISSWKDLKASKQAIIDMNGWPDDAVVIISWNRLPGDDEPRAEG